MPNRTLAKPAILALFIVITIIGAWEIHLRNQGDQISYDDGGPLWSNNRAMVYEPADKSTVFLGSSRMKYDLDIATWEKITRKHAIQLAAEGTSPLPVLEDLAGDPKFKGKVVMDVMEPLLFSGGAVGIPERIEGFIKYYHNQTPAQLASFQVNHLLESQLVFLDKDFLSLSAKMDEWMIPDRPGIMPNMLFPLDFSLTMFDRQMFMTPRFVADTNLQKQVQNIWATMLAGAQKAPPPKEDPLPGVLERIKKAVDLIRSRGGEVVFIRPPSSGPFRDGENHGFPRAIFYDRLLSYTQCKGYHYMDDPVTNHFICLEWSHLKPVDAVIYTKELTSILPESYTH